MPNGTPATDATPQLAQPHSELEFIRLCMEVACGPMFGLGELVEGAALRAAVIGDVVRNWLALAQFERDAYRRPDLPDSALVTFAWEYIDRVNQAFDDQHDQDDQASYGPLAAEIAFATYWQRHAMRLAGRTGRNGTGS